MSGVKGRSGRKTRYQKIQEGNLEDICTKYIVDNFDMFDDKTKLKISLQIASKAVTQKTDNVTSVHLKEERCSAIADEVQRHFGRLN